jgi:hypothetical protein
MSEAKHRPFDPDSSDAELVEDLDQVTDALLKHVEEFAEEHDLPDGVVGVLLLEIAVTLQSVGYVGSVEKPSASGLRRELDRTERKVGELIRSMKKSAEVLVAEAKEVMERAKQDEQAR